MPVTVHETFHSSVEIISPLEMSAVPAQPLRGIVTLGQLYTHITMSMKQYV